MNKSPLKSFIVTLLYAFVFFIIISKTAKIHIGLGIVSTLIILGGILYFKRATFYSLRAQMLFNTDKQKAFELFEKAYKTNKMKPQIALLYCYLLLRDAQVDVADKKIDEILEKYKTNLSETDIKNAHLNKALIKWKSSDLSGAIKKAEALYESGFKTTALYGVLGYWYILDNQYQKAFEINKEAYEYNNSDLIIADNLAQNYYLLGDLEKSYEMYLQILKKEPTFIEPYYNFALVLIEKNEKDMAIKYLKKALEIEEKFLSDITHKQINELLNKLGNDA